MSLIFNFIFKLVVLKGKYSPAAGETKSTHRLKQKMHKTLVNVQRTRQEEVKGRKQQLINSVAN